MTAAVLVSCLLVAGPSQREDEPNTEQPVERAVPGASIDGGPASTRRQHARAVREHTRALLRREATTSGGPQRAAVRDLVAWYEELLRDEVLPDGSRQELARLVRARLVRVADRIRRDHARRQRLADRSPRDHEATIPREDGTPTAGARQQIAQISDAAARATATVGLPSVAGVFAQMGVGGLGGVGVPPLAGGPNAAGGPGGDDYGDELVTLIQDVISPTVWDINGGPGVVRYYRPLRVLVIRAPGATHDQVGRALGDLRGAGN